MLFNEASRHLTAFKLRSKLGNHSVWLCSNFNTAQNLYKVFGIFRRWDHLGREIRVQSDIVVERKPILITRRPSLPGARRTGAQRGYEEESFS